MGRWPGVACPEVQMLRSPMGLIAKPEVQVPHPPWQQRPGLSCLLTGLWPLQGHRRAAGLPAPGAPTSGKESRAQQGGHRPARCGRGTPFRCSYLQVGSFGWRKDEPVAGRAGRCCQ